MRRGKAFFSLSLSPFSRVLLPETCVNLGLASDWLKIPHFFLIAYGTYARFFSNHLESLANEKPKQDKTVNALTVVLSVGSHIEPLRLEER